MVNARSDTHKRSIIYAGNSLSVSRDDFEHWLFEIDDELAAFFESLPSQLRDRLNFSLDSLVVLEGHLLSKYSTIDEIREESESRNLFRYSRYVGEAIRKLAGGIWDIELNNPDDAYFQLPKIVSLKYGGFCPVVLVTSSIDRRKGDRMKSIAKVFIERADASS